MNEILKNTEPFDDADEPIGGLDDQTPIDASEGGAPDSPERPPMAGSVDEPTPEEPTQEVGAEDRARARGWKPKDEWSGDPKTHVSAEEFLKRGIESKSVVLKERDKLSDEIAEMRADMARQQQEARQREAQVAINSMQEAKTHYERLAAQARKEQDFDTFEEANRRANEAAAREQQIVETQTAQAKSQPDPVFEDFLERNSWYSSNAVVASVADEAGRRIAEQEGLRGRPLLDKVEQNMREIYPQLFQNPKRQTAAPVESSSGTARGAARNTVSALGSEYVAAFNEFYDEFKGDFKSRTEAETHYVKMIKGA